MSHPMEELLFKATIMASEKQLIHRNWNKCQPSVIKTKGFLNNHAHAAFIPNMLENLIAMRYLLVQDWSLLSHCLKNSPSALRSMSELKNPASNTKIKGMIIYEYGDKNCKAALC